MEGTRAFPVIALAALTACVGHGWQMRTFEGGAYQFKPGPFNFDQMQASAVATHGAQSTTRDNRLEVALPAENKVYLFTRDSNPAHPSLIILTLEPEVTPFEAYSAAPTSEFEAWLLVIGQERDQIVATYLRRQ